MCLKPSILKIWKTPWRMEKWLTKKNKHYLAYTSKISYFGIILIQIIEKVKRYFIKVKLVTLFDGEFSKEFLEKCYHSLRISVIGEMKKSAKGNKSKC